MYLGFPVYLCTEIKYVFKFSRVYNYKPNKSPGICLPSDVTIQ